MLLAPHRISVGMKSHENSTFLLKVEYRPNCSRFGKDLGEIYYALYTFVVLDFGYIVAIQKSKRRQCNGDALVDNRVNNSAFWSACKIHGCDRSNDA